MTAKRRLISMAEAKEALELVASYGVDLSQRNIDITSDGVRVSLPAAESAPEGNAYDRWKAKDQNRDASARRQ